MKSWRRRLNYLIKVMKQYRLITVVVSKPREGAMDSELLTTISILGSEKTRKLNARSKAIDPFEFLNKVKEQLKKSNGGNNNHDEEEEDEKEEGWVAFGKKHTMKHFFRAPAINILY
jgi:hypothetical protein